MSTEPEPTPPAEPEGDPPPEGDPTPEPEPKATEDPKFTQADLDRIVQDRLRREREKYADYDELKAKAAEAESEQEKAIREAREQATNEVRGQYQTRAIRDAARAAAAGKWVRPEQAVKLVDLSDLDPDADNFDTEVQSRLDAYLAENSHLAVPSETPSGSGDAGSRPSPSQPGQLSRTDLKNMSPEDINKARLDGRLNDVMGVKT